MITGVKKVGVAIATALLAAESLAAVPAHPRAATALQVRSPNPASDASSAPAGDAASQSCKRTKVAVLGAGIAGITAAQALSNNSITDFIIVEYNNEIGGRVKHTNFGRKPNNNGSYVIEEGANWVQGIGTKGGPENPIWRLARAAGLKTTYSNYSSIKTYSEKGYDDFSALLDQYEDYYSQYEQDAGQLLLQNIQDRSARTGLSLAGWKPKKDMKKQATDWWEFDWEYGESPEISSQVFSVVNYNTSFYQWSDENNLSVDQRGFNWFIRTEAATFLKNNDPRLLLNTIVKNISYSDKGVTVSNTDGSCIQADYAICTFSLGVLQNADNLTFTPALPSWKRQGIESFSMSTYTKIFFQFPPDKVFWDRNTQFFLYADPDQRGYYPVWQSLDTPGFLPGSGILFVTVVTPQSYVVEAQDDATTKAQALAVLRTMFGKDKVPDPIGFYYPRWSSTPWAYGSYSNWPIGTSLEMHQNLRANVGRLWFAGEANSAEYYGFLQGAWTEGKFVGTTIAGCINGSKTGANCKMEANYPTLHGTTDASEYDASNGWTVSSFEDNDGGD